MTVVARPFPGVYRKLVPSPEVEIQEKLAELVERCKEVAKMVGEGRDVFAECSYCHGPVPLWEALFTQQLSGFLAHLSCPAESFAEVAGEAAPVAEFDYSGFVEAVELRMESPRSETESGVIASDPDDEPKAADRAEL
ncbi:MAG: hypothetical protein ABI333_12035 [bacterium]